MIFPEMIIKAPKMIMKTPKVIIVFFCRVSIPVVSYDLKIYAVEKWIENWGTFQKFDGHKTSK